MSYRGDDLDLRTPSQRAGREPYGQEPSLNGSNRRASAMSGHRVDAIVVDDTVLACCNHAYDVALAHGASEVRLEHLVHALTRVEVAAEVLESRGIREAHLRRESAAVIASEIPVGLGHSHSAPRASVELEDVLRRASDLGRARGEAAGVHDLLWVLLNYNRDIPAISLLLRHAAGWQQWDWPHQQGRRETRQSYYQEPVRVPAYAEPRSRAIDPMPAPPPAPMRSRTNDRNDGAVSSAVDALHQRLDQMDQSLRQMQSEMAADRRMLSDLVRGLQRDLAESRPDNTIADRMTALERSVSNSLQEGHRTWNSVHDRVKGLDKLIADGGGDAGLGDLVTEQLVSVSDQMRATSEKVATLERALEQRQLEAQRAWNIIGERLKSLDDAAGAQRAQAVELRNAIGTDLRGTVERAVSSQAGGSGLQAAMAERFQALQQQFDRQALAQTSSVAQLTEPVMDRLRQLETLVKTQADANTSTQRRDTGELHDALVKLGANQATLAENLDQWRAESEGGISIVSNRLELLERSSAQPIQLLTQLQADMQGLQQVTLADYDHNRKGFRQWMFGTDEPFAGSWRDETAQIRQRLKQLRDDRKA